MKRTIFVSAAILIAALLLPSAAQMATDQQTATDQQPATDQQTPMDQQPAASQQPVTNQQTATDPQAVIDAQKAAVAKYPDLGRAGSPLHTKFLELYHQALDSDPALFANPNWPLIISDQASALLGVETVHPAPSASPDPSPAAGASPAPTVTQVMPAPFPPEAGTSNQPESSATSAVGIVRDCIDIIFLLVAGTVVVLAFKEAKNTIFMPLKTETFKLQLRAYEDLFLFFEKHPSVRIDDEFDLDKILYLNAMKMLDAYAATFFADQFKKEEFSKDREKLFKDLAGGLAIEEFGERYFQATGHYQHEAKDDLDEAPSKPVLMLAKWKLYEHDVIYLTKSCQEATEQIRRFNASPLLPKDLKELISGFDVLVRENFRKMGAVLTESAKELPVKYPTFAILGKADLSWILKRYNHARVGLEEKQDAILTYLEQSLQIDNLLEPKDKAPGAISMEP
jgi:hypothetical protein